MVAADLRAAMLNDATVQQPNHTMADLRAVATIYIGIHNFS